MRAAPLPFGSAIFCDDIRQEVGNKPSLMGVYQGEMLLAPGTVLPAQLPKLGVAIYWNESIDPPFDELLFKVGMRRHGSDADMDDEQPLGEIRVNKKEQIEASKHTLDFMDESSRRHARTQFFPAILIAPFPIFFEGVL